MISKTLTGITFNEYNSTVDLPFYINDTFFSSSKISFSSTLSFINDLLSLSINSGNITNYRLYVRIASTISPSVNILYEDTISLTTANIVNSSLIVSCSDILSNISHDYLCYNTSEDEKNSLYKTYKIIFRIFDTSTEATHLANKNNILATDIVQDLNLVFNVVESGSYDVGFSVVDILKIGDFTSQEIVNELNSNIMLVGGESVRIFYPKNKNQAPLIIFVHGVSHEQEDYDAYMQRFASYGYICVSININLQNLLHIKNLSTGLLIDSTSTTNQNFIWGSTYVLKIIDHIKRNISKIKSGFFNNKIDFSKINLFGHSRGGAIIHTAKLLLDRKNSIYGNISTTIQSSDIKSLIKIAPADGGSVFDDGTGLRYSDITRFNQIQEADLSKFSRYTNTSILTVRTQNDGDVTYQFNVDDLQSGISFEFNRNIPERIILINQHLGHSELRDAYGDSEPSLFDGAYQTKANLNPIVFGRNESYLNYNSTDTDLSLFTSEFILFLAINNYNSNKLKKLRLIKQNIKNKKINTDKYPNHALVYFKYEDIKLVLDSYDGITLSYAGTNGLTFSSIGYTYDYGNDADYYRQFTLTNFNPGSTYMNALKNNIVSGLPTNYYLNFNRIPRFNIDDTFNGIIYTMGKSLFLPIESNFSLGYTLGSSISINENEYFCLTGTLKYFPSAAGNTLDANFNLTIFDNSLNSSTLSSKMCGGGFNKIETPYKNSSYLAENNNVPCTMPTNVFFRGGDFVVKNPNLDLNNINQIMLSFGPDYGSTFCHVSLDDFIIIKEL